MTWVPNIYAYVAGNPVSRIDPLGLTDWPGLAFGSANLVFSTGEIVAGVTLMATSPATTVGAPLQFIAGLGAASSGLNGAVNSAIQIVYAVNDTSGPGLFQGIFGFFFKTPGEMAGLLIDSSGGLDAITAAGRFRSIKDAYDAANYVHDIGGQCN